jgi:hypothetical protein
MNFSNTILNIGNTIQIKIKAIHSWVEMLLTMMCYKHVYYCGYYTSS